jgi:serine/threonine protein kinase
VLDATHRAGLRHGAIKPSNVLVRRDGKVKLTDFGGTAEDDFLAPELPEGAGATVAGDLYALGVLARKCLAGAAGMTGSATTLLSQLTADDPGQRPANARTVAVLAERALSQLMPPPQPQRARRRLRRRRYRKNRAPGHGEQGYRDSGLLAAKSPSLPELIRPRLPGRRSILAGPGTFGTVPLGRLRV